MEASKKDRKIRRAAFTKHVNELENLLSAAEKSTHSIKLAWEIVQQKYSDLQVLDERIYALLLETDADEMELTNEMELRDTYFKRYTDFRLKVEQFNAEGDAVSEHNARSQVSQNSTQERSGKRQFKLPTIEFRKFGGDIREWLGFWAQFEKIHDDPDIDLHDKIVYLAQATVAGSKARQLVESYPAVSENYAQIINSLKARFGRKDILIEVYVRELLRLILNNAMSQEKMDLSTLYDKIESHLRALETLGITKHNCASMLFPLIESCLPENLLRAWQRSAQYMSSVKEKTETVDEESPSESRLGGLMNFLRAEIESEQRISLATEKFGFNTIPSDRKQFRSEKFKQKSGYKSSDERTATATGLVNCDVAKCIFCEGSHDTENCFKAKRYTLYEKKDILSKRGACFRCLKLGHLSRKCRGRISCMVCGKSHITLMCPEIPTNKTENEAVPSKVEEKSLELALSCLGNPQVFMQTLRITISNGTASREVRALMDTGSQRSYILRSTARELGYVPIKTVKLSHALFGGQKTAEQSHNCYKIRITDNNYFYTMEVLDQNQICSNVQSIHFGEWIEELKEENIHLSDMGGPGPIEILLGADVVGKLYTGRRHSLKSGLVAIDTLLGWTLMGKVPDAEKSTSLVSMSMLVKDASISDLWALDVLGITEPTETKNRQEMALATKEMFQQTIIMNREARYEVCLPWIEGHPPLSNNYTVAERRLDSTIRKLKKDNLLEAYDQIFSEWLEDEIIEKVPEHDLEKEAHYLPHRAVIKDDTTTKIRPVFDASSCEKGKPSLNSCLEIGPNLIESIPAILLRFRMYKFGVISDIRKAFLQISLYPSARDSLRFLWVGKNNEEITYRHRRVVFGVNCSPFLLGATIEHHLELCKEKCTRPDIPYSLGTINKLSESFYVDNCVTSLEDEALLNLFIKESIAIMNEGSFDLRGWEYSHESATQSEPLSVLGLSWYTDSDVLSINKNCIIANPENETITKRQILSMAQRIFDPIGFTCPTSLYPKLMLQKTWKQKLSWDDPVDEELRHEFCTWVKDLDLLTAIKIPRCFKWGQENYREYSLHVFCDASIDAYATVIYLRIKEDDRVFVYLLAAKTRVAPLKKITIPRLELLAATIGARLYHSVKDELKREVECYFWSDSSTVISWIRRGEEWSTFIWNRVQEIRSLTPADSWRHVTGTQNPADLPSRGCSIRQLVTSKWWEGPRWLYQEPEMWPNNPLDCDEEEISQERKKKLISMVNTDPIDWHFGYFSKYNKTINMIAWVFRFKHNIKNVKQKRQGRLTTREMEQAEIFILKTIQTESFPDIKDKQISMLNPVYDKSGLIRLKSRVSQREDMEDFCYPILLPSKNQVVSNLIFDTHVNSCHVGVQGLLSLMREKYWVLGGRRTVRSIINKCSICRRHNAKRLEENPSVLPIDRVRDAGVFEVTGVDFTGPLHLKTGEKAWICLFTCAVYRAVHLELTTSLSTSEFVQVLRRFIARRGRPKTIYSDNGTNFIGMENCFARLDWDVIFNFSAVRRINWRFNPPTAAWWGGFWERLVGVLKQLLRKVLQRASLSYEELMTVICDCEAVVNSRPLTYVSNNPSDLVPLTPNMFLQEIVECGVPDCDAVDGKSLTRRIAYRQKLREVLRARFRSEYLGQLKLVNDKVTARIVRLNEVVLIGNDNSQRLDWPLGRVIELIPGKDGKIRLVRLKTAHGQLLRPVQRLYPLEVIGDSDLQGSSRHLEKATPGEASAFRSPDLTSRLEEEETDIQTPKDANKSAGVKPKSRAPVNVTSESAGVKPKSRVSVSDRSDPENIKITRGGRILKPPKRFL